MSLEPQKTLLQEREQLFEMPDGIEPLRVIGPTSTFQDDCLPYEAPYPCPPTSALDNKGLKERIEYGKKLKTYRKVSPRIVVAYDCLVAQKAEIALKPIRRDELQSSKRFKLRITIIFQDGGRFIDQEDSQMR
jgi:hypothetical protein